VIRFLGRAIPAVGNLPGALKAEGASDIKTRPEGVRIKHRPGENSIKMYNQQGSVLRVETTINDAAGFNTFRVPEGKPESDISWHPMRAEGASAVHALGFHQSIPGSHPPETSNFY